MISALLRCGLHQQAPTHRLCAIAAGSTCTQLSWPTVQQRYIREEQLAADADAVAELFEASMSKASRKKPEGGPRILTTRREAIHLYREIMRYSTLFVWRDQHGRVFRDVIRESARKEYDDARFENDPEIINKLIITGRDAVTRTVEAFAKKRQQIIEEEAAALGQGPNPGFGAGPGPGRPFG